MTPTALLLALSCLGLVVAVQAQNCSRPVPGANMDLRDEYILLPTFLDGSQVYFACNVGYVSAGGSAASTCTAGTWSPIRLRCKKKRCSPPDEVAHGRIHYPDEIEFGAKIVISCDTGHRLIGKSEISCGAQGWTYRMPICEVVTCGPPPPVAGGTFSPRGEIYQYKEVARYSCQKDLTLNGTASIECSEDGAFHPAPPSCIKVECFAPHIDKAARADGYQPSYGFKATLRYQCDEGHKFNGTDTLTCGMDSQWSPKTLHCQQVECSEPRIDKAEPVDGSQPPYVFKATVTYKCQEGYKLYGTSTLTCGTDSQWSPELPHCQQVECSEPRIDKAERVDGSQPPYVFKATVTYKCQEGYKLYGTSTLTCGTDSQWSPELPYCQPVTCAPPRAGSAATFSPNKGSYEYQDEVQFSCQKGFELGGPKSVKCSSDGTFKPSLPTCTRIPTTSTPDNNGGKDTGGLIIGVSILGVAVGGLCCGCIACCAIKKKKEKSKKDKGPATDPDPDQGSTGSTKSEEKIALSGGEGRSPADKGPEFNDEQPV